MLLSDVEGFVVLGLVAKKTVHRCRTMGTLDDLASFHVMDAVFVLSVNRFVHTRYSIVQCYKRPRPRDLPHRQSGFGHPFFFAVHI